MRRRVGVAVLLASAAALWPAPPASAGTVGLVTKTLANGTVSTVSFADSGGERNDVGVTVTSTQVQVTDRAVAPVAAAGCTAATAPATVVCPLTKDEPLLVDIQGGGGDDALTLLGLAARGILDAVVVFLAGGEGNDTITAMTRVDESLIPAAVLNGDGGDDRLVGGAGEDQLSGGAGRDTLIGAGGDDDLDGDGVGRAAGQLAAALDDKTVDRPPPAPPADDVLDGGPGEDTADYVDRTQPLRVDLANPAPDGSDGEADQLAGIEDVYGGDGPNVLLGDARVNRLYGSASAADVLEGRGGDDSLFGSGAGDTLRGGAGDDYLQQPGPRSSCGSGRDTVRNPRSAPAVLRPLSFVACELALSRGGIISLRVTPVRLRAGVFTIQVANGIPAGPNDPPVRFAIVDAGRTVASRTLRLGGKRDKVHPLTLRLRGRPPRGSSVRVVLYEPGIYRRSLYVELPLRR